jgi:hypothetical protein
MADDEFLSDDDYVHVPLKEVARHELHPTGTSARIADLEASILFWKKDAIAGNTRIRELEARQAELEAALSRAVGDHGHDYDCSAVRGMERDCHCGWAEVKKMGLECSAPSEGADANKT